MSRAVMVGLVPEGLRPIMSQPLPDWTSNDKNPLLKTFSGSYHSDSDFKSGQRAGRNEGDLGEAYTELLMPWQIEGVYPVTWDRTFRLTLYRGPLAILDRN